jgi:hypothetical protein
MSWFRSKSKQSPASSPTTPTETPRAQETTFSVGDRVEIGQNGSWSAGSTGEVTYISGSFYEVMLDDRGLKIDASSAEFRLIAPYVPHVFQVGQRVRLPQEFVGNTWHTEPDFVAGEGPGPDGTGDPVSFPAGTVGTVMSADPRNLPPAEARYLVGLDRLEGRTAILAIRGINLERIPGRARIVSGDDGIDHVVPLFSYHDHVLLRKPLTGEDGSTFEAGLEGAIDVAGQDLPVSVMATCWETGIYTVSLFEDQSGRDRGVINVHASVLQLKSDFLTSPYPSISWTDEATDANSESASSRRSEAADGSPSAVDTSAVRDLWAWVVAATENDEEAADAIVAKGDHVKAVVRAAAVYILAKLREQGTDPVAYSRSMIGVITEKGAPGSTRDLWAFIVAAGEDDQKTADAILARGDHVEMLVWATSHIMGKLREQGIDPAAYGRSMMEVITEKGAKGEL